MSQKDTVNTKKDIVKAALQISAELGWESVSLESIANTMDIQISEIKEHFIDKYDILIEYNKEIDQRLLSTFTTIEEDTSVKDRLFDIVMERFDILNENRDAVLSILSGHKSDPKLNLFSMPYFLRSICIMMKAAGINMDNRSSSLKAFGLSCIYFKVLCIWKSDDSPDLSKTMACLDKALYKADKFATQFF
jgi:AcrR family transcriptional regulator